MAWFSMFFVFQLKLGIINEAFSTQY